MNERVGGNSLRRWSTITAMLAVVVAVAGMSLYANLPVLMTTRPNYKNFPPFTGENKHDVKHLGAEYNAISVALVNGRGFADPFRTRTGPTAWMPPMYSWILAALRWDANGDIQYVQTAVVVLQDMGLIVTGWLLIALARRSGSSVGLTTLLFIGGLCYYFRQGFQFIHDCWIVLAALDVLIAGLVFVRPFQRSWLVAAGWGVVGGLIALTTPAVAFIWGLSWCATAVSAVSKRARSGLAVPILSLAAAALAAAIVVSPWLVRNYQVFGRFIPIKSNLAFELYQSQCVQEGGVLHDPIWQSHPNHGGNAALFEYAQLGEMAYMDRKWEQFKDAVRANPGDFLQRIWNRLLEATLVYVPFNPEDERRRPDQTMYARLVYPLPFVCLIGLVASAYWFPLGRAQWVVIAVYLAYLMPYVAVSYYDRYKFPVMVTEIALVVWGVERLVWWGGGGESRSRLGEFVKPQAAPAIEGVMT
jgi:hypothetical protein